MAVDFTHLKRVSRHVIEVLKSKISIVDLLCQDTEGNRFIVEMQVNSESGFEKRAQYYAAKAYIAQKESSRKK